MDNYNGTSSDKCRMNETWKALDLYHIAVSDKGRIRVNGNIEDAQPPQGAYRSYFRIPKGDKVINRDAANVVWRAFKGKLHTDYCIKFIDGNYMNLNLDNLRCEKRHKESEKDKKKRQLTDEQMRARVPLIIEKMVKKWGCKNMQQPLTDVKS